MIDLLKLTGPITLPQYNLTVDANNFLPEVQYQVEKGYFENMNGELANEPKTILKDIFPQIMSKINDYPDKKQLIELVSEELREKQVMFYFDKSDLEKIVLRKIGAVRSQKKKLGKIIYI